MKMDFESPDVEKDFPGLYASESLKKNQSRDSDYSDDEKLSRKDLLGKKKEKKESKKDKGYVAFEGESSGEGDENKSPSKSKKNKPSAFKFPGKDKKDKKVKETKEKKEEKEKTSKKESKEVRKDKETKDSDKGKDKKVKKKKESRILRIKDRKKKNDEQTILEEKPIFGVPLQVAVERSKCHDGIELPIVVRECIDYIEEHGLTCEGIYRISGLKSKIRKLKMQYNRGEKVYLYEHEPHIVASLLKQFLRDLPEPILTEELTPEFEDAAVLKGEHNKVEALGKLIEKLPRCNRLLLSWIFVHMLHVVNLEKRNKMNLQNILIVLSPAMQISHHVFQAFFTHSAVLFKGVELKKYVPPIDLDSSRLSLELPDSPSAIADELARQENALNELHAQLNTGLRDKVKEEQLWEIQRIVTQLKRKLRFFRQVEDTSKPKEENADIVNTTNNSQCGLDDTAPQSSELNKNSLVEKTTLASKNTEIIVENNHSFTNEEHPQSQNTSCIPPNEVKMVNEDHNEAGMVTAKYANESFPNPQLYFPANDIIFPQAETFGLTKDDKVMAELDGSLEDIVIESLLQEENVLRIHGEELAILNDELKRKINAEKMEIHKLKCEINEYQQLSKYRMYSFDSTENSSSESEDSSTSDVDEEEDLVSVLEDLIRDNQFLQARNVKLTETIQLEREKCVKIKVQVKLMQAEPKCR